jgi:hypothetical protein
VEDDEPDMEADWAATLEEVEISVPEGT